MLNEKEEKIKKDCFNYLLNNVDIYYKDKIIKAEKENENNENLLELISNIYYSFIKDKTDTELEENKHRKYLLSKVDEVLELYEETKNKKLIKLSVVNRYIYISLLTNDINIKDKNLEIILKESFESKELYDFYKISIDDENKIFLYKNKKLMNLIFDLLIKDDYLTTNTGILKPRIILFNLLNSKYYEKFDKELRYKLLNNIDEKHTILINIKDENNIKNIFSIEPDDELKNILYNKLKNILKNYYLNTDFSTENNKEKNLLPLQIQRIIDSEPVVAFKEKQELKEKYNSIYNINKYKKIRKL